MEAQDHQSGFLELTPDKIIDCVETHYDLKLEGFCRPLSSYINRVFELHARDSTRYVAKFYRPDRWSIPAIQEEHDFIFELQRADIPVIAPIISNSHESLMDTDGIPFCLFEFKGGRSSDEFSNEQWQELGRLCGRMHNIGAVERDKHRITMLPQKSFEDQIVFLLDGGFIPAELDSDYENICVAILELIEPLFSDKNTIRIHGDLHSGNLIQRPDEGFFILDFDDMCYGDPVQDFWMLLPGYYNECSVQIKSFVHGYRVFRDFNIKSLALIEPLRVMRYIHFCAWCAHQVHDNKDRQLDGNWGSVAYWQKEIEDLREQKIRIEKSLEDNTFMLNF